MLKQYLKKTINKQSIYNVKEAHYVINYSYSIQKLHSQETRTLSCL
ncbi:hypothetical protein VCRA2122O12_40038 [Vibrio crassostreae]|nr:hypothetical protein VCRA2118O239_20131 [Vibrio crassostreae]CAK2072653.1 hypothetical protein VCRA2110O1_40038 [Vibrio crassostreae]CAK2083754.1 hypothetical protein VCRA2110O173_30284 [Vibrio crassostreae]CAK2098524.1 hypothetical protein VCRA2113O201_30149 [Vibrio crassostreae]CAK2119283.1 hypothetical protein VCRA2113O207_40068 [Vibrio crassostreae]